MSSTKSFKPTILHNAVLITLLCVTLALIGVVEYACRVLPQVERKGGPIDLNGILGRRDGIAHDTRDSWAFEATYGHVLSVDQSNRVHPLRRQLEESNSSIDSTPSAETTPPVTLMPAPIDFLQTVSPSISSSPPIVDSIDTTSSIELPGAPPPSSFLQVDSVTPVETSPSETTALPATTRQPVITGPSETVAFPTTATSPVTIAPATGLQSVTPLPPGAPSPTAFLNSIITSNGRKITQTILPNVEISSVRTVNGTPVTHIVPAFTTLVTANGTAYVSTILATAAPTGGSNADDSKDALKGGEKDSFVNGGRMYFLGAYLPVILATLFALPWTLIGETTKSLEPFYQIAKNGGSPTERSLTANFNDLLTPFWALFRTQWATTISSVLAWLAFLIVPLAPEAVSVHVIGECKAGCNGRIGVFLPAARAIEGALAAMVVFQIILIAYLWRKTTGVSADPRCIAGLATIFSDPDVQREFSQVYSSADQMRLDQTLQGRTYRLETLTHADGYTKTVAITGAVSGLNYVPPVFEEKNEYYTVSTMALDQQLTMRHAHRVAAIAFAALVAGLLGIIITYRFTGGDTGFERFMSGQGFGVKFLFTLVAVIIAWFWARLFRAIALYAPYRRLFAGEATARESILLTAPLHPILGIRSSISAGHYLLALIAGIGLLSEVLCVTLSAIPFHPSTLYSAYNISTWVSVTTLAIMLIALVFIFFYREPVMPIKPDTVAGNLVYLCDGSLPEMFKNLGSQTTKERDQSIENMGVRYDMGYSQTSGTSRMAVLALGRGNDGVFQ